jgi:hypothetical protein
MSQSLNAANYEIPQIIYKYYMYGLLSIEMDRGGVVTKVASRVFELCIGRSVFRVL